MSAFAKPIFLYILASVALAQPAGTPKLGADAPSMGYKEVPEWPVLNAAGKYVRLWGDRLLKLRLTADFVRAHIL